MKDESLFLYDFDGVITDSMHHNLDAARDACKHFPHDRLPVVDDIRRLKKMTFQELGRTAGVPDSLLDKYNSVILEDLRSNDFQSEIFDGIEELLLELSKDNTQGIVTTNLSAVVSNILPKSLEDVFTVIYGGDIPGNKTDKILRAINNRGVSKAKTVMIGDAVSDITSAQNAEVKSVAVTWGFQNKETLSEAEPDFIVDTPKELLELLLQF